MPTGKNLQIKDTAATLGHAKSSAGSKSASGGDSGAPFGGAAFSAALAHIAVSDEPLIITGAPEGFDACILGKLARFLFGDGQTPALTPGISILHVARDDQRLDAIRESLRFFAPDVDVLTFPAWDCVPYDRVSPHSDLTGRRIATLARLARLKEPQRPVIVLATVNSVLQRVPPREAMSKSVLRLTPGARVDMETLAARLDSMGFVRSGTVMEPGEYAMRGGIFDVFPPAMARPARLDFFGDVLEGIRAFDPATQRSQAARESVLLLPVSEVPCSDAASKRFRQRYMEMFGAVTREDPLYEAVSARRRYQGVEHWLPLFYPRLDTLLDYTPGAVVTFDHLCEDAKNQRFEQIADHYEARRDALEQQSFGAPPYKPTPPQQLFLDEAEWTRLMRERKARYFTPFDMPDTQGGARIVSVHGKTGRNFAIERAEDSGKLFDAATAHVARLQSEGKRVIIANWTNGARERLGALLDAHGLGNAAAVASFAEAKKLPMKTAALAVLGVEHGFETPHFVVLGEQDILGDRLVRRRKHKKASDILTEATSLTPGDLVVHADHGVGRFLGLKTVTAARAPHDCLEIEYHGGDKLFLPVENIELLSRYGSEETGATLDKLGGVAWQARKAKLKKRIRDIAESLIKVAAMRALKEAPVLEAADGMYDEFCARFPYEETEDQLSSIEAVLGDMAAGRPMDRLVCGDVGFGKTEVALRAAFVAVMAGKQVAVVTPTTLLSRQHFQTFTERFQGFPVNIGQASRLVGSKQLAETRAGLKSGQVDIVVGTHALLGKTMDFKDMGLMIIDEEQHFGVKHKERLKQLREEVHVLTLSATPIPRTLQLALSGVREMSIIATPPVDRLAVRTFISPFDAVVVRESLLRERYRGGQSFYVCPRVADLPDVAEFLREHLPELRYVEAHGQMASKQLEDVMAAFYDRQFDVLLCTTIVESGLDIPTANTLIVHRADMFGLAQLYQLRGRVGRSKIRAYALFTTQANGKLTPAAEKRLKVLHSLDTLGAGFTLASHDLDIRGAGNLLGEEQSGHIREVGFELYQSMLEEAVASLRDGAEEEREDQWSPAISIGAAVLIPENYVSDLQLRLGLYRRLSGLSEPQEIEAFAAELMDRFGPLPDEVKHLLAIVHIKGLCRKAGVASLDAGPKGAVVAFRNNTFANPQGLVRFMTEHASAVKMQTDHRLVFKDPTWDDANERLKGARQLVRRLAEVAQEARKAA
jgi:transcription-repair coupling factor (superfamily II helicase)